MPSPLQSRLDELARRAPTEVAGGEHLWQRGRRRRRVRALVATATVVLAAVAFGGAAGILVPRLSGESAPAGDSASTMQLPTSFRAPQRWGPSYDGAPGRLSGITLAERAQVWGGSEPSWAGVSAVDGSVRFLDYPELPVNEDPVALSPDGRFLAFWLPRRGSGGWSVARGLGIRDNITGRLRVWRTDNDLGVRAAELTWVGSTLWWEDSTVVRLDDEGSDARSHGLRTWDMISGEQDSPSIPRAGLWPQIIGAAPGGPVFEIGPRRLLLPDGDGRAAVRIDRPVQSVMVSGGGERLAANIDPTTDPGLLGVATLGASRVSLDRVPGGRAYELLGWRGQDRLAVRRVGAPGVEIVHVDSGRASGQVMVGAQGPWVFAQEVWAAPMVEPPDLPFAPNRRLVVVLGAAAGLLVAGLVLVRRRGRHGRA